MSQQSVLQSVLQCVSRHAELLQAAGKKLYIILLYSGQVSDLDLFIFTLLITRDTFLDSNEGS